MRSTEFPGRFRRAPLIQSSLKKRFPGGRDGDLPPLSRAIAPMIYEPGRDERGGTRSVGMSPYRNGTDQECPLAESVPSIVTLNCQGIVAGRCISRDHEAASKDTRRG